MINTKEAHAIRLAGKTRLEKNRGLAERLSKTVGVSRQTIQAAFSDDARSVPNMEWLPSWTTADGPALLDAVNQQAGRISVPLPKAQPAEENVLLQLAVVMDETGDVAEAIRAAVGKTSEAGRSFSRNEKKEVVDQALEAAGAIAVLVSLLTNEEDGDGNVQG